MEHIRDLDRVVVLLEDRRQDLLCHVPRQEHDFLVNCLGVDYRAPDRVRDAAGAGLQIVFEVKRGMVAAFVILPDDRLFLRPLGNLAVLVPVEGEALSLEP